MSLLIGLTGQSCKTFFV